MSRLLLCTDLDRTLLPNGAEPESEQASHQGDTVYLAQGGFMGMNGNSSAGILQGVVYFIPQAERWLRGET